MKKGNQGLWILGGLAAAIILGGGAAVTYSHYKQRGIRNNNPGNLVKTAIEWRGKVPLAQNTDSRFEQFTKPEWGIRAMFMDVRSDIRKGRNTIARLISEYAPPSENNTAAYIAAVAAAVGISKDAPLAPTHYPALLKAIIKHENGVQPYPDTLINQAIALAA